MNSILVTSNVSVLYTTDTGPTLLYPGQPVLIPDVTGDLHPDLLFPGVYKPAPETRRFPSQESILMNHLRSLPSQAQTTTETRLYGSGAADLFKTSSTLKYTSEEDTAAHFEEQPPPFVGNVVNEMVLVSGITGKIVGKPYKVKQCHQLTEVTIDGESIDYSCVMPSGNSKYNNDCTRLKLVIDKFDDDFLVYIFPAMISITTHIFYHFLYNVSKHITHVNTSNNIFFH